MFKSFFCLSSFFFFFAQNVFFKKKPWSTLVGLKRNDVKNLYKSLFSMVNLLYISTAEKKNIYIYIRRKKEKQGLSLTENKLNCNMFATTKRLHCFYSGKCENDYCIN